LFFQMICVAASERFAFMKRRSSPADVSILCSNTRLQHTKHREPVCAYFSFYVVVLSVFLKSFTFRTLPPISTAPVSFMVFFFPRSILFSYATLAIPNQHRVIFFCAFNRRDARPVKAFLFFPVVSDLSHFFPPSFTFRVPGCLPP